MTPVKLHRVGPADPDFRDLVLRCGGEESPARMRTIWQRLIKRNAIDGDPANEFELPVFDRPMVELPSGMTCEEVVAEFDEIIRAHRLREVPGEPEDVPEFMRFSFAT